MRLTRFQVQGYKNLRQSITLEDLGAINVIHGENNVGKSNVLEAIELLFVMLAHYGSNEKDTRQGTISAEELTAYGFPRAEIVNLDAPTPIELEAHFALDGDEREVIVGGRPQLRQGVQVALQLEPQLGAVALRSVRLQGLDERGRSANVNTQDISAICRRLGAWKPSGRTLQSPFGLVGLNRRVRTDVDETPLSHAELERVIPYPLLLALWDASQSMEPILYRRWELFVEAMKAFDDLLGEGEFVAIYDRKQSHAPAGLVFQTPRVRIPVHLLGSGVQQIVALLARMLTTGATILGVEEPELNLRFTLQRRVYEVFERLTRAEYGPSQIFLTSHSPAFEHSGGFYAMLPGPDGPTLEKRPAREAAEFTQHTTEGYVHDGSAPLSYVTSDGLVQLPEHIQQALGLEHGGGVIVREGKPYVELLTDEQFMAELRDGDADDRDAD